MVRARAALVAGKGQEASTLIRALRDYATLSVERMDARNEAAPGVKIWSTYNTDRRVELRETLTLSALQSRWAKPDPEGDMRRAIAGLEASGLKVVVGDGKGSQGEQG